MARSSKSGYYISKVDMSAMLDTTDSRLLLENDGKRPFIHPVPQRQLR